jgi:hypothetical protein
MAARIVVGVFESEGIAEDARNRLRTEGVPASDIVLKVLKEIGPIPSTMEPELEASFLGPVILGNFRESFARYIRNGETLICVQTPTDERVELAVDTLSNTPRSRSRWSRSPRTPIGDAKRVPTVCCTRAQATTIPTRRVAPSDRATTRQ